MAGVSRAQKETSVVVVELGSGDYVIIVSISTRSDTQVISVDPTTGALCFSGRKNIDVFTSEADAARYINSRHLLVKSTTRGKAILGYAALGGVGLLLIATKVKSSVPELPGGDIVYTVTESQWVKITLKSPNQSKVEAKNASELTEITLDGLHFYCESRDITRHFPSIEPVDNPDKEFVWNEWLSAPFKGLGLPRHCAVLLQGFAEYRGFTDARDNPVTVAVIARRSRLHPGTRYLARGLGPAHSTGNEVECEQLVWPSRVPSSQPLPFSVYIWRRGTVPIWWGAEIKSQVSEAEIYVADSDPYVGSGKYFNRIAKRYTNISDNDENRGEKSHPLIFCVNLLRTGMGRPELVLAQHFLRAINFVKTRNEVPDAKLLLANYDWHEKAKTIGEQTAVLGLWELLKDPTIAVGFSMGEYFPDVGQVTERGMFASKGVQGGFFKMASKQDGVIRFNCADSLDRTNAASFLGAVQVLVEQCRRLGLPLDSEKYFGPSSGPIGSNRGSSRGSLGPLPPGWEMRSDAVTGQVFYIDHNTRTTTWNHPCPDEPWRRFDMTVEEFRDATLPGSIAAEADLFLIAGDIHAMLYTGSKAMHSHIIQIFSEDYGKGKRNAAQNMAITLQRRFLNVVMDSSRQKQLEMFLGYRLYKYFPTLPGRPLQVLTRPHAFLLKPVPSMFPVNDVCSHNFLLSNKFKDIIWVCPPSSESAELLLYLAEPCHVCQLLLTLAHGTDDVTSPGSFDVRIGRDLGDMKLVMERTAIPRCANGTSLTYSVPGPLDPRDMASSSGPQQKGQVFPWLYDFGEQEGGIEFLSRVVAITFYPAAPGKSMTLGQVEILGASLIWTALGRTSGMCKHKKAFGPRRDSFASFLQKHNPVAPIDLLSLEPASPQNPSTESWGERRDLSSVPSGSDQVFDLLTGEFQPQLQHPLMTNNNNLNSHISPNNSSFDQSHQFLVSNDVADWNPFVDKHTSPDNFSPPSEPTQPPENPASVSQVDPGVKVYLDLIKTLWGTTPPTSPKFQETLELEVARLHLGLSALERDRALLSAGRDPATVDPHQLVETADLVKIRQTALQVALLTEIDAEDKDLSDVGFDTQGEGQASGDDEDYHCLRTGCISAECQVTYVKDPRAMFPYFRNAVKSEATKNCISCKRVVCAACQAGKGSGLLHQSGSNLPPIGPGTAPKPAKGPSAVDAVVCKSCCSPFVRDTIVLSRVRTKLLERRQARVRNACEVAMDGLIGVHFGGPVNMSLLGSRQLVKESSGSQTSRDLTEGETSVADFPYAGIISSVPTAQGSKPVHTLLVTQNESDVGSWAAPIGVETVELCIVLSTLSVVSSIVIIAGAGGYAIDEALQVDFWYSNLISDSDRNYVGRLDIKAEIATTGGAPESFRYKLRGAVSCRIFWLKLTLPSAVGRSTEAMIRPPMDLLSLDTPSPRARQHERKSSDIPPCIHVQRILVLGQQLPEESDPRFLLQSVDKIAHKALLDAPPRFGRLRVQVDVERPLVGGRVVEMFVNQQAPNVTGFRLEAFAAVKNVAKYTSGKTDGGLVDRVLGGSMEELMSNLPTLRIRVSSVQESKQSVPVGEYLIPTAKPGTPLYFDFPGPVVAKLLVFELLGNISAMSDEDPGSDEGKEFPLPSSLSLMNKIRIYQYTPNSDLSKWPQLSAV